ncbi:glycosyltransferase family 2 protein [Candidatus Saccharibacteria bacterium]|nr:glycosyltransferase family 2 protein [Candidatus Saccharibacteria bacterium]
MNTSRSKKVSVVVPNYNYKKYIKGRVRSILRQTYPIYELLILDDASTDGSAEMLKEMVLDLKLENPKMRVKFVPSTQNSGKAMAAWKKGFELAEGDFVWIAEADDLSSPRFLEEAMKGFDDPKVVLSYTESAIINGVGLMIAPNFRWSRDKEKTGHFTKSYVKDGVDEIREIMAVRCTIPNVSGVVFKKTPKLMKYLKEALEYRQVGDWYLYLKLMEDGKIAYNRKALNRFRIHKGSATERGREHLKEVLEIHEMVGDRYDLDEIVMKRMKNEEERIAERMRK